VVNLIISNSSSHVSSVVLANGGALNTLAVQKLGAGTQTLTGNNTYTGGTLVSAGTLAFNAAGTAGTAGINVASGAMLEFGADIGDRVISNSIWGAGSLVQRGGNVRFAGELNLSGGVSIDAGTFHLSRNTVYEMSAFDLGAAAVLTGAGTLAGRITVRGTLAPGETYNGDPQAQRREVAADEQIWPTVNWASFDQDKVVSFGNFQYAVYWDADRALAVARRNLSTDEVQLVRFPDYLLADGLDYAQQNNGHRNAVVGLSPLDGRLHLAWDHHNNSLNYTRSRKDLITDPPNTITTADFELKQPIAGAPAEVTYPAFINDHQDKLMFFCRSGGSGSGDVVFFEYDAASGTWTVVAERLLGLAGTYAEWNNSTSRNAYLHDVLFDGNGRLHISWVWREAASTWASNHDLNYAYSDDRGRTWRNNAGEQIADVTRGEQITIDSPGIVVWPIPVYSWLMNQCGMTLDSRNNPHVATYHMEEVLVPETVAHDPPPAERWRLNYYHYWRDGDGVWHRRGPLPKPVSAQRPVIVAAPDDTIIIYFRTNNGIMAHVASAQSRWTDWRTLTLTGPEYTFPDASKPDRRRLKESRVLSLTADPNSLAPGQRGLAFLDFPIDPFLPPSERYGTTGTFEAPAGLSLEEGSRLVLRVNGVGDFSAVTSTDLDVRGEVHVYLGRDYAPAAGDAFAFLHGPLTSKVNWVLPCTTGSSSTTTSAGSRKLGPGVGEPHRCPWDPSLG
jgi:autotransporter-associated beta strand protein